MADPGTPVGAPASGVVTAHGSAQGGQALYLTGDDGYEYWLGHIEPTVPVGARVVADQPIATVSADHPRPHLHITKRPL
jgi:murein DD-endopeptidase MepM/ murein hydrolase activator NlpD